MRQFGVLKCLKMNIWFRMCLLTIQRRFIELGLIVHDYCNTEYNRRGELENLCMRVVKPCMREKWDGHSLYSQSSAHNQQWYEWKIFCDYFLGRKGNLTFCPRWLGHVIFMNGKDQKMLRFYAHKKNAAVLHHYHENNNATLAHTYPTKTTTRHSHTHENNNWNTSPYDHTNTGLIWLMEHFLITQHLSQRINWRYWDILELPKKPCLNIRSCWDFRVHPGRTQATRIIEYFFPHLLIVATREAQVVHQFIEKLENM